MRDVPAHRHGGVGQHDVDAGGGEAAGDVGRGGAGERDGAWRDGQVGDGDGEDRLADFQEHPAAPAGGCAPQRAPAEAGQRIGERLADGDGDHRAARGECQALRKGDAAADAGEAAGADGDGDRVHVRGGQRGLAQAVLDHDRQDGGVAAVKILLAPNEDGAVGDDRCRTSSGGRIEGEDAHDGPRLTPQPPGASG